MPWHAPYAAALRAYWFDRDHEAELRLISSLGEDETLPISVFFRGRPDFFPFEQYALELCRGRVLDMGAGTGLHSLALQERGFLVEAVELVPDAVEIARARGVREIRGADFFTLEGGPFDTILMLMNGIGPCGTLDGIGRLLHAADRLLDEGGQILVDSGEASTVGPGPDDPPWPVEPDGYPGEAWIQLEHGGLRGEPFRELYVDQETFSGCVAGHGWSCEIAFENQDVGHLARVTRS